MTYRSIWPHLILGATVGAVMLSSCVPDPAETIRPSSTGRLCGGMLSLSGNFHVEEQQPDDVFGCWPVGTWRFKASIEEMDCPEPPTLLDEYAFEVTRDKTAGDNVEKVESYHYLSDPMDKYVRIKVSSGGGGLCQAGLELFSADGTKVLNLKPALEADETIDGFGEYDVFDTDRR